jgi:glycosyltransferase involved in cell wall biosynthesis
LKLAIILHTPKAPHSAVYVGYRLLADDLEASGHAVTILAPQDSRTLRRLHARWYALLYPIWVATWVARHRREYDLVLFHSYSGWIANLLGAAGLRSVTAFHGLEPVHYRETGEELRRAGHQHRLRYRVVHGALLPVLIKLSCRRSDLILCLNRSEQTYLTEHGYGVPARIEVVGRGISSMFFRQRDYEACARRLLFVGQWIEHKGIRYLVEAFERLAREDASLELWCVGVLVPEAQVQLAFAPDVRTRVTVQARIEQHELPARYANADIFVFPSVSDGFGRALLEAMATATPIVTSAVGVAKDALRHEVSCLVVPTGDADALVTAIKRLTHDPELRRRLGSEAQRQARPYESRTVSDHLTALFTRVLGAASGSRPR